MSAIFKTRTNLQIMNHHEGKTRRAPLGRDCMTVGFTTTFAINAYHHITTKVASSNPAHGEMYSIQRYVIKLVSYLRQVGGFFMVPRFPLPIKLTATI
jgi:hypothetical protein